MEWQHVDISLPEKNSDVWIGWEDYSNGGSLYAEPIDAEYRSGYFFDREGNVISPTIWMYSNKPSPPTHSLVIAARKAGELKEPDPNED